MWVSSGTSASLSREGKGCHSREMEERGERRARKAEKGVVEAPREVGHMGLRGVMAPQGITVTWNMKQ